MVPMTTMTMMIMTMGLLKWFLEVGCYLCNGRRNWQKDGSDGVVASVALAVMTY